MSDWSVVYEKAIRDDGSLYFPERLTKEFLDKARKIQGSYIFANQYQNEIIPDDEKRFKSEWLRYYKAIPENVHTFAFIDPAIGQKKTNDYTGIVVVSADEKGDWYLRVAKRERLTPTEIVEKMFELHKMFRCQCIGVEIVAYQEALLYIADQEMRRRNEILPLKGIRRGNLTKETRVLGLVPRFEWQRISIAHGLADFEDEYSKFPRGSHDDIIDALASLEELVFYPEHKEIKIEKPNSPTDPTYERWFIHNAVERANGGGDDHSSNDPSLY